MVSRLGEHQRYLEVLLEHRLLDSTPRVSDAGLEPGHLRFQHVPRWCWCRWSRDHISRTTGLERLKFFSTKHLFTRYKNPCSWDIFIILMPCVQHSWRKLCGVTSPADWLPPPSQCPPPLRSVVPSTWGCRSAFISGVSLDLCTLQPGLWSGSCACVWCA